MSNLEPPDFNFNSAWTKARLKAMAIMLPIIVLGMIITIKTRISDFLHIPKLTLFLSVIIVGSIITGMLHGIFEKKYIKQDEDKMKHLETKKEKLS